jgi:hypothetical protein
MIDTTEGVTAPGEVTPEGDNADPESQDPQDPETPQAPEEQSEDEQYAEEQTTDRGTKVAKGPESRYYHWPWLT